MVRRPVRQVQAVAGPQRSPPQARAGKCRPMARCTPRSSPAEQATSIRSEEHTSELQSLMRISYAVFCLKKKNQLTPKRVKPTRTRMNPITKHDLHINTTHTTNT